MQADWFKIVFLNLDRNTALALAVEIMFACAKIIGSIL